MDLVFNHQPHKLSKNGSHLYTPPTLTPALLSHKMILEPSKRLYFPSQYPEIKNTSIKNAALKVSCFKLITKKDAWIISMFKVKEQNRCHCRINKLLNIWLNLWIFILRWPEYVFSLCICVMNVWTHWSMAGLYLPPSVIVFSTKGSCQNHP